MLLTQHQDTFLFNDDHLYIVINFILYTKTYILIIRLSTHHNFAYHKYNAFYLRKTFINDFKRISRRVNL